MARKRQLALPGVLRTVEEPRGARRDWTDAEFRRALERNGFEFYGAVNFFDTTGTDLIFEAVHTGPPLRIARRATLAKLLRERALAPARTRSEPPVRITGL